MDPWILWFLLGLGLIAAEFFVPGIILVFLGLGAWCVSVMLGLGLIDSTPAQLVVFATASLLLLWSLRRFVKAWFIGAVANKESSLELMDEFAGKRVQVLTEFPLPGSYGKVEFKGAEWKARAEEPLSVGDEAEIVSLDGLTLNIRRRWLNELI